MADLAGLISAQVDLLWSTAFAMLVAELYLIGRFFTGKLGELGRVSKCLLAASTISALSSMLSGYLSYGAAIDMVRREMINTENAVASQDIMLSFSAAETLSLAQFAFFAIALLTFILMFFLNTKTIGEQVDGKGS